MEVSLGPWTADKSIEETERQKLRAAMASEALNTVKHFPDFTATVNKEEKPAKKGYAIDGRLTKLEKQGKSRQAVLQFNIWVDGEMSNFVKMEGRAKAEFGASAEDAVRAVTEDRVKGILGLILAGKVTRLSDPNRKKG